MSLKNELTHLIEEKKWKDAALLIETHPSNENDDTLLNLKYTIYSNLKETHMEEWLDCALQCYPQNAQYHYEKGVWHYKKGELELAINAYSHALKLEPDNTSYRYYLGCTLYNHNRYEEAISEMKITILAYDKSLLLEEDTAIRNKRDEMEIHILEMEQRWDEIVARALGQSEETFTYGRAYGITRAILQLQDIPLAKRTLEHILSLFPTQKSGSLHDHTGRWHEAQKEWSALYYHAGLWHEAQKEWSEAIDSYENAISLNMHNPTYRAAIGILFCKWGKHAEALLPLRTAIEQDASKPVWWIHYARALYHTENLQEALIAYDHSLNICENENIRNTRNALESLLHSGNKDFPASFYDKIFATSTKYLEDQHSIYEGVWQEIVKKMKQYEVKTVLDLGCGPGQFCLFLLTQLPFIQYTGLDFSTIAIENAKKRCPNAQFGVEKLPLKDFTPFSPSDVITCLEVLEHITQDIEIVSSFPSKHRVIMSVPTYDSSSHVRFFTNKEQVYDRYASFFEDDFTIEEIKLSEQASIWLMCGIKK